MPRPKPSIEEEVRSLLAWSDDAQCRQYDPTMFDTVRFNHRTLVTAATQRAIEVCLSCPVMMRCLTHAVLHEKTGAIWGGMTDEERAEWDLANQVQEALVAA